MKRNHRSGTHHEQVKEHARGLVAATSHIADSKVAEAREKLSEIMESAQEAVEYAEEKAVEAAKQTDHFIREKPYQAVGLAIGIGALLGFCLARRK